MTAWVQRSFFVAIAFSLGALASQPASALAVRVHPFGGGFSDIFDNGVGDLDPAAASIRLSGPLGGYDLANVLIRSGIGGALNGPFLTFTGAFENTSESDPGELFFQLVERNFVFNPPGLAPGSAFDQRAETKIRGVTSGDLVTVITNVDRSNVGFESVGVYPDQLVAYETYPAVPPNALSISDDISRNFTFLAGAPFSLRSWIGIDHGGLRQRTNLVVSNAVVPLPATGLLLASGLVALIAGRLGRRSA